MTLKAVRTIKSRSDPLETTWRKKKKRTQSWKQRLGQHHAWTVHSCEPFYGTALGSCRFCFFGLGRKTSSVLSMCVFCYSLNTTHNRCKSFGDNQTCIRGYMRTTQILCCWELEHPRIWVPQGVLELTPHRYSGDYPCVISFNCV